MRVMQYVSEAISIAALALSAFAFAENRRNNRIGQAPALFANEVDDPAGYSYAIQNKGGGPAMFERVEYFLDGKPLDTSLSEAIRKELASAGIRCRLSVTQPAQENVLQAGEQIMLVQIAVNEADAAKLKAIPSNRLGVRITFKSVHGKRRVWASDDGLRNLPRRVG